MPRLPTSLFRQARIFSNYLPLLLAITRDLHSAINELRWLKEYLERVRRLTAGNPSRYHKEIPTLSALCHERATGKPLQYILGSQPFGNLEILCKKGVLIPRPETETYTSRLIHLLLHRAPPRHDLKILDLCAGTGCIGLGLIHDLLPQFPSLSVRAIDINPQARALALKTLLLNQRLGRLAKEVDTRYNYALADVLDASSIRGVIDNQSFDILVSNPPYISLPAFSRDTSRSAKGFEPRNALLPTDIPQDIQGEATGDVFYRHILRIAYEANAKVVIMEVADLEQAWRVIDIVKETEVYSDIQWTVRQIWCDDVDIYGSDALHRTQVREKTAVIGAGKGRVVVLAREWGSQVIEPSAR